MIREATLDDLFDLALIGKEASKKFGITRFSINSFYDKWSKLLQLNGYILIDERDGKIISSLGFVVEEEINTGELIGVEMFWYGSGTNLDIIKRFEEKAISLGCKKIFMSALMTEKIDKIEKFYGRKGYYLCQKVYCKEV